MVYSVLCLLVAISWGFTPSFLPPAGGTGSEIPGESVRAFSMGGASAGVPDSGMVVFSNPAASAWARRTGLSWGTRFMETGDENWSGAASFPDVSVIMPLPLGVQLSAALSGRSRLSSTDTINEGNVSGLIDWRGATAESYTGLTLRASRHLAFSAGGRCFFGYAMGDAVTTRGGGGSSVPIETEFRDDVTFGPAWGMTVAAFLDNGPFAAGFAITTDRSGTVSVNRDYMGNASADTSLGYTVPGDIALGLSARVHRRVRIACDYHARKAQSVLGSRTENGSIMAAGVEYDPGGAFLLRGGYRHLDGLWRDGASRFSGGFGYSIAGGMASIDIGAGWETWGNDQSETVFSLSIRASENWLGQ